MDTLGFQRECDTLERERARLLREVEDKKLTLLSKPTILWASLFRKIYNILAYPCKKIWSRKRANDTAQQNLEDFHRRRLRAISGHVRKLKVASHRLEAEILDNAFFSWPRFFLHWQRIKEFWPALIYRLLVKNYPYRLGNLYQYPPRPIDVKAELQIEVEVPEACPKIQIVIPSYQQAIYLERTLRSVLDQNYPSLKLRVYDGGSVDGSVEIIRRYESQLAGWVSQRDNGQTDAIHRGLAHPDGQIMAYLNSDDLLLPGALHRVGSYFAKHPEVDVVYGHRVVINAEDQEIGRWFMPEHDPEVLRWADYLPQETMFWRRSLYEKVGGMDVNYRFAMDWDLILRFQEAKAKFVRLPHFLGAFRVHQMQKTTELIHSVGLEEMRQIRQRVHLRDVSNIEVAHHTWKYLLASACLTRWEHFRLTKLGRFVLRRVG